MTWGLFQLGLVLGPGAFLLGRWQFFDKEPSRNALIVPLLWTYLMLFMQYNSRNQLAIDHQQACQQLENLLVKRDADTMDLMPESVDEWESCYRYTEAYLQAEADYRADEAAN